MKVQVIELKEYYPVKGGTLKCIAMETPWSDGHEDWKRPAVVIAPGGGYTHVSKREGEPIALAFLEKGFQAFILDYVCSPEARYPEQLIELASAVDYVKKHAKEYSVNPNEVFVIGFSAGGHLTANLAVEHQTVSEKAGVALDCKPTAVCLSYAAITEKAGCVRVQNTLLMGYSEEEIASFKAVRYIDEAVSEQTPPSFIWATAKDNVVDCQHSLLYATALAKNGVAFELHIYPEGGHGRSTGSYEVVLDMPENAERISQWTENCAQFFRAYCEEKF